MKKWRSICWARDARISRWYGGREDIPKTDTLVGSGLGSNPGDEIVL
jgi:hypothetical protein